MRFTLQMKDLVWHCVVRTWDTFSASKVDNELGVLLRGKGPHKTEVAHDIVHINSLMIYTNLIDYTIDGDTKARLLRCLPFFSNLKAGDIITSGQYINSLKFRNLPFRPLLKMSFHSINTDLRDTGGDKKPTVSVRITGLI